MGRPTKLTPETKPGDTGRPSDYDPVKWAEFLKYIAGGVKSERRAAAVAKLGIRHETLCRWKADYPQLSQQVEQAHAERQSRLELEARKIASRGDQSMLKFLLQSEMPTEYGEKRQIDITAITADVTADKVNDATRKQLREIAKRVFDASGTAPADED